MAARLSNERANDGSKPTVQRAKNVENCPVRRSIATFTLAAQASGDTLTLPSVPKGAKGVHHRMTSSVSLGTSTIAIGISGNTGKYRAAAVFTAVDTPTAVASAANLAAELTANEAQFATIAAAALPASGTLVIETFYTI